MQTVILFGATGNLGRQVAKELISLGYDLTCVARSEERANTLQHLSTKVLIANVLASEEVENITKGFDVVVSCLGKSVSPLDWSKHTFQQVDLEANTAILLDALRHSVRKFIYVSAFQSERFTHLEYFRVHHEFSERLSYSGIDYCIVKPPAIFSAFLDAIVLAKKGWLVNFGTDQYLTNPIHEADLAAIIGKAVTQTQRIIEVGGMELLTRQEINEIVQRYARPGVKLRTVPESILRLLLLLLKIYDINQYDKFVFYHAVLHCDMVAPQVGQRKFEDYVKGVSSKLK